MYKGVKKNIPNLSRLIRYLGLFIPILLVLYGVYAYQYKTSIHPVNICCLYLLSFWWLVIGILQFITPVKTNLDRVLRLCVYHLVGGTYMIFISGIPSPLIAFWVLLMIVCYVDFSIKGAIVNVISLVVIVIFDILLWSNINSYVAIYDLLTLIIALTVGVSALNYIVLKRPSKISLEKSNKDNDTFQLDRIYAIVNNLTDGVLSTDSHGIIQVYNASSLNLLDTNDNLNGRHIDEVLPLTNKKNEEISLFKEFKELKTVIKRDDLEYSFDDGEKIRLELTYAPIRNNYRESAKNEENDGYIIIFRDVTKAKSLEEERDEFISVTSHELRTPITIAEGTISNVQVMMDHPNVTKKMLKDAVDVAHEQIIFLAHMVNDLSTLSRAERGASDAQEDIDVRELAHMLHDKYVNDAKAKKLHLDLDLSPKLESVHVSRLYVEELIQNFITNALKYTKKGSITINFTQKDDIITFAIKDTGIGLSKTDKAKVFEKFYRSEDYRTRETSGTGLGLYIAAKLAHKLNTKIELTSRLNFGSTFSFSLPAVDREKPKIA